MHLHEYLFKLRPCVISLILLNLIKYDYTRDLKESIFRKKNIFFFLNIRKTY